MQTPGPLRFAGLGIQLAATIVAGVFIGLAPECLAGAASGGKPAAGCSHAFTAPGGGTVPVNAPSAGPQDHFDSVMSDAQLPRGTVRKSSRPVSRASIRKLLDFLLG